MTDDLVRLDPPPELSMALGEAMFTQRAIRRLDPDRPVDDRSLRLVLDAASKAPSGGNAQPARFVVLRDRALIEQFGSLYHEAWWAKRRDELGWEPDQPLADDSPYRMAALLAAEMGSAPVIVLAWTVPGAAAAASSVLPGVQNLMLAARALGIGSVLTTLHPQVMERVHELLGVPADARFHGCIPLGYPRGRFGTTARRPSAATTSWDRWDAPPPWA
ncbi:MAG: nitroreductase family protein [Actinomycetota bacterium]|nr:nitroreductase family protein [Actinomycetota bacterium]